MTQERKQTPLPWRIDQDNAEGVSVVGSNGNLVAMESYDGIPEERGEAFREQVVNEARANWRLVVNAVNPQPALLQALEAVCGVFEGHDDVPLYVRKCRAAIALAKGEE